jgi:hypothetical protein
MALLLLLLVLAYIGSLWASSERRRAFGTPSGIEYVLLGALLGPEALGVLGHEAMQAFEPIAIVALGWIGLLFGLECGLVGERRAPLGRLVVGLLLTITTASVAAALAFWTIGFLRLAEGDLRLVLSGAVGLVTAETTRHAVRWIGERQPLSGPLAELLLDLAAADDAPVLLALAFLLAQVSGEHVLFDRTIPPLAMAGVTIGSGVLLGGVSAWLIGTASSRVERWTILLGAAWVATGMSTSLGLSALAANFALGLTLNTLSGDAGRLRTLVGSTEGAVLLPALLLAGARLALPANEGEIALIALAVGVRFAISFLFGFLLSLARPETRGLGGMLGAGMLASGTLTMIVAFGISLRCPPEVARPALAIAFVGTLLGELIGPAALRRAFGRSSDPPPTSQPELPLESAS